LRFGKNQIHVVGKINFAAEGTPVYIDVEGDPDRDFYYCIGLRFETGGLVVQRSFWADGPADERKIWAECILTLDTIDNPKLVYYGAYETSFLRHMKERYSGIGQAVSLDPLMTSALNLLATIYAQVYFPTYSNGLKDIAHHLGFHWSEHGVSGLVALHWRRQWEISQAPELKQKLLNYNAEDCAAAQTVAEVLSALSRSLSADGANAVDAATLKREYPQRFGKIDFALPEFQEINDAAQWDHQREKIYLRSSKRSRRRPRKIVKLRSIVPIRRVVEEERPTRCEACGSTAIKRWGWLTHIVFDLKLSATGIRRSVVRYSFPRYICWHCRRTFHQYSHQGKYGTTVRVYAVYQIIELQLSQNAVAKSMQQIFGIPASAGMINRLKVVTAKRYEVTYQTILNRIVSGTLVHADETRATIIGRQAYVWVFTNLEDVAFVYSESREASTPQNILKGFQGVLVSDFYTGYDSIACAQQKCLVHLMRDINEDLCKQPFNEEMKGIARSFADLLRPIVASVDQFGLKARYLRKHQLAVDRFYKTVLGRAYRTDVAAGYQRRFDKNRDRLFTFLDHDGIPWNNNNAEHAIKAFARLRNIIGGTSTAKGLQEYLTLLSISETCKNKGGRFLDFLMSQKSDVDEFVSRARRGSRQS
jgi:Transposase IS66 family/RNase_H superfamily